MVNYYSGVISPVFKYLNAYAPKSTMGVVDPLKVPSSSSMMCSDNFKFDPNYVDRSCYKIISYLLSADSSTWHFHVKTCFVLSASKVKSNLILGLIVIFPACMCHCITASLSVCSFLTSITITTVELHPRPNGIQKFLNFALPILVFIHPFRIWE